MKKLYAIVMAVTLQAFLPATAQRHEPSKIDTKGRTSVDENDVEKLSSFQRTLKQLKEDYWATQVEIQRQAAAAWLAFAEGKRNEALELMRSATALEDSTDKHPVTPGWIAPAHGLLGQMLLELNRPREAGDEFAKVLKAEPNRFRALYGAARAAEMAGDSSSARELYGKLVELAPDSDRLELRQARTALQVSGG